MLKHTRLTFSFLYRACYKIHHLLFLRPQAPLRHAKVIIVGSFRTGGAGKTPFVIWLANRISQTGARVAVLCHKVAWDEHLLLQQSIPKAIIISTGNRYKSARKIDRQFDYVICDDGFEDTRFSNARRICLDWQTPPETLGELWPSGENRSLAQDHLDIDLHLDCHTPNPDVTFFIESIKNTSSRQPPPDATIICGLGNPVRFTQDVEKTDIRISTKIFRKDHDRHFAKIVEKEIQTGKSIIISEKDACRLPDTMKILENLFICKQSIFVKKAAIEAIDSLCR